jgi:hypothetical protein
MHKRPRASRNASVMAKKSEKKVAFSALAREDVCFPSKGGTLVMIGPSGSGKTTLLSRILTSDRTCFAGLPPIKWTVVYRYEQPLYERMREALGPRVEFVKDYDDGRLETFSKFKDRTSQSPLVGLVVDDEAEAAGRDETILEIASGGAHHKNIFFIFITQHAYFTDIHRLVMRQAPFLILWQNLKHPAHARRTSREIFGSADFLPDALQQLRALRGPFGAYCLLDLRPELRHFELCCRSGPVFDGEDLYAFAPAGGKAEKIPLRIAAAAKDVYETAESREEDEAAAKRRELLLLNLADRDKWADVLGFRFMKPQKRRAAEKIYTGLLENAALGVNEDGDVIYLKRDGEVGTSFAGLMEFFLRDAKAGKASEKPARPRDALLFAEAAGRANLPRNILDGGGKKKKAREEEEEPPTKPPPL